MVTIRYGRLELIKYKLTNIYIYIYIYDGDPLGETQMYIHMMVILSEKPRCIYI